MDFQNSLRVLYSTLYIYKEASLQTKGVLRWTRSGASFRNSWRRCAWLRATLRTGVNGPRLFSIKIAPVLFVEVFGGAIVDFVTAIVLFSLAQP